MTALAETPWPVTIEEIAARWKCGVRWLKALATMEAGLKARP